MGDPPPPSVSGLLGAFTCERHPPMCPRSPFCVYDNAGRRSPVSLSIRAIFVFSLPLSCSSAVGGLTASRWLRRYLKSPFSPLPHTSHQFAPAPPKSRSFRCPRLRKTFFPPESPPQAKGRFFPLVFAIPRRDHPPLEWYMAPMDRSLFFWRLPPWCSCRFSKFSSLC